jgi:hypothetical protein
MPKNSTLIGFDFQRDAIRQKLNEEKKSLKHFSPSNVHHRNCQDRSLIMYLLHKLTISFFPLLIVVVLFSENNCQKFLRMTSDFKAILFVERIIINV